MALRQGRERRRLDDPRIKDGIDIIMDAGIYRLYESVIFRSEDLGTESSPTIIRAAVGKRPILSGGLAVTGWKKVTGDPECNP